MREKTGEYLNYFLPREVLGPVFVVFSLEHVIEILFTQNVSKTHELIGWTVFFLVSLIVVGYWGMTDDDYDDFVEEIDE